MQVIIFKKKIKTGDKNWQAYYFQGHGWTTICCIKLYCIVELTFTNYIFFGKINVFFHLILFLSALCMSYRFLALGNCVKKG